MQLELETEVTLARKRQALAEALVAGRNAFVRFVFHEVGNSNASAIVHLQVTDLAIELIYVL